MKKIMFIAVSVIMMATATAQGENKVNPSAPEMNYKLGMNFRSMSRYLQLNEEQKCVMERASDDFRYAVSRLEKTTTEKRADNMQKALRKNLSYAHEVLSPEQYHRYLIVLNITIKNNGLDELLYSNELAAND